MSEASAPAMRVGPRLAVMFSLETASLAAYAPLLSLHAREGLALGAWETSLIFAVGPLTAMIGPPLAGWLADRLFRAEQGLAITSLLRAFALALAARANTFEALLLAMALHGLFVAKSGVLLHTIAFHHLPDARRFGSARVWGTASWSAMIWATTTFIAAAGSRAGELAAIQSCFYVAAGAALGQAVYALTLPATTPAPSSRGLRDALLALKLFASRRFVAPLCVALLSGSLMQANLILQGLFFADPGGLGLSPSAAGRATTASQILELTLFPFLGLLLQRFGVRKVVLIGMLAWPLRYAAYLAGGPAWFVIAAQALHGLNYALGFTGLQIAIELMAPTGLRASAQAAFIASSSGLGNLIGQLGCGYLLATASDERGYDWGFIFSVPLFVGLLALAITIAGVRDPERDVPVRT
ncbi:MAG TPA: MFS transporter [Polyangiaceae bacterium]